MWVLEVAEPMPVEEPKKEPKKFKKLDETKEEEDPEELKKRNVASFMCTEPPMIGSIKASDKFKTPKEFKFKVKTEDPAVIFSFYHLSAHFL